MDSLAFDWGQENCWLVPPVYLVARALLHFLYCQSRGVLVVPFWPLSLLWPYLVDQYGAFWIFFFFQSKNNLHLHYSTPYVL